MSRFNVRKEAGNPANRPRLILTDDHLLVLESLAVSIGRDFEIAGCAASGRALLDLLPTVTADCIVLDLAMPVLNGIELIPIIRRMRPAVPILILTMHEDRSLVQTAMTAGARGFIPKCAPYSELRHAIRCVLTGAHYVSDRIPARTAHTGLGALHEATAVLTPRQEQILLSLGQGKSCAQISRDLHVAESTIAFHKQNILRRLGFSTSEELRRYALLISLSADNPPA